VSEIEDTVVEGLRGRRPLPYAHWITMHILRARPDPLPPHIQRELTDTVTVFPHYDPSQMLRAHIDLQAPTPPLAPCGRAPPPSPRATRSSRGVLEIEDQDIAIGAVADAEAKEEIEFASDSSDDDYRLPIPDLPPRQHDQEAGGSSSAIDPALLAILEGMRADQQRAAEEQARRDRE
jgi:hypothetical protein